MEPGLKHQDRPEGIAMVAMTGQVLVHKGGDGACIQIAFSPNFIRVQ